MTHPFIIDDPDYIPNSGYSGGFVARPLDTNAANQAFTGQSEDAAAQLEAMKPNKKEN